MSVVFDSNSSGGAQAWREWPLVAAGLLALYVPTFYDLAGGLWQNDDHAHGPIILGVVVWLVWRERAALLAAPARAARGTGFALLVLGLLFYVVGRSQDINVLQVGSLVPVLAGVLLAMRGWTAVRALWFPLLFAVFLVPFPNVFVDAVTGSLKQNVSAVAESILYAAGYPIGRSGVMLTIGQYQMLVADACSGLNSMFSLSALGFLYLYLMQRKSVLHNALVVASILPIAFTANIIRVLALILVTYYFGDEAGQGFLHGAAGMVLVMAALILLLFFDAVLAKVIRPRSPA
ncbi:MAG: exosortase B [Candidatus Parcubacteria bacterium]|nr:exosortase B [Burkholderiales bacterium]